MPGFGKCVEALVFLGDTTTRRYSVGGIENA